MSVNKYPAQSAIEFIDGTLIKKLPEIQRIDAADRSKVHLFELGKGGKQFAVIVGDMNKATGKFGAQQTRILLEALPGILQDVMPLESSDFYNGSRIATQSDSRLTAPKQHSVMVGSEAGLRRLLEWYSNAPATALAPDFDS